MTRLLVAPLVRALRVEAGDHRYLRFLEAFRYPLAGETAMDAEVASSLRIPGHWGMDIGILSDVYARCEASSICQVSVADAYDHKHQDLSADDPTAGLRRMSIDVTATMIRRLGPEAIDGSAGLCDAYLAAARELVRHYANDAELNGYLVDVAAEQAIAEVFARSVADAVALCRGRLPRGLAQPVVAPSAASGPRGRADARRGARRPRSGDCGRIRSRDEAARRGQRLAGLAG